MNETTNTKRRGPRATNVLPPAPKRGEIPKVADYVSHMLALSGKTQKELADELGFSTPNMVSMIKNGRAKVPIQKTGQMAKALNVDPIYFLQLVLREYQPETWDAIEDVFANQPILTANEVEIIETLRAAKLPNPKLATAGDKKRFQEFMSGFGTDNALTKSK
ncbi:helix-turn-helix transcriptional regulator [Ralstonia pickettii]|uniref:helix-turn-helix domain-containing protein n=1 Tax=Ralstonia pickettii TaxID=329 RepID=UPI0027147D5C|nr:helix-turn-helix transcriptional regulator [Ralstonia pickettii]WKZ86244.1 helix-turn-helix transcriptional regulator [Ralstonia pickettii]